jgi:hypothetical protein
MYRYRNKQVDKQLSPEPLWGGPNATVSQRYGACKFELNYKRHLPFYSVIMPLIYSLSPISSSLYNPSTEAGKLRSAGMKRTGIQSNPQRYSDIINNKLRYKC